MSGTRGFLLAWDESVEAVDPMLTSREHVDGIENWRFYEVELGSTQPAALVSEIPAGGGRGGFITFEGRSLLNQFAGDLGTSTLLDLSERPIEVAFTIQGGVQLFARLEGEPLPRMAHRIEPQGSLHF